MELLSTFSPSSYRYYCAQRSRNKKLSTFPPKHSNDYLDYSVDFSRLLQKEENLLSGNVRIHGSGLVVENIYIQTSVLTAFVSGGYPNRSFYLTYKVRTNRGNILIQEMILSTHGEGYEVGKDNYYMSFESDVNIPRQRPPLNAIKVNNHYLIDNNGFFIGI